MSELNVKYQLGTKENEAFLADVREGLFSFGHNFPAPGGSSYYLGDDGTPWKDRNRETWITSRMAHVYSLASFLGSSRQQRACCSSDQRSARRTA